MPVGLVQRGRYYLIEKVTCSRHDIAGDGNYMTFKVMLPMKEHIISVLWLLLIMVLSPVITLSAGL
jgi:hypothetical protein